MEYPDSQYAACGKRIKRDRSYLIATCPKCRSEMIEAHAQKTSLEN